jgi:uncharacterized protein YbjT (DUF2867 family)
MSDTILVTGATGTIGSRLVKELSEKAGVTVRVGARDPGKVKTGGNVTAVAFDYAKPETIDAAVKGADRLFLLTPFSNEQVALGKKLVDAARAAGVRHVVKLSAIGCDIEPGIQLGRWHREVERHVEASGIAYTLLRPNNYMDNFINYYPPAPDGNLYLPLGSGATSYIDARDIAAVAAAVLTSNDHQNKAYELTGGEALTAAQVAGLLSEATGRSIHHVDVPEDAAKKAMLDLGMPGWMVDAMMELHAINKAGYAAGITGHVQQITGRAPRTFREFARDYASTWKK